MSKIRYSKDCKQVATAFLDASNCGTYECDRIFALSGGIASA
ncbi:hypothetical protein [Nostoc sp. DedQUE09]|nr:hypothetical protein [Nostoc sp. DedQUE09]MDZ7950812.1 hypothetical protein [Nostoc sp. DedQUE09]